MNRESSAINYSFQFLLKKNRVKSYRLLAVVIGYLHLIIFSILLVSGNNGFVKTVAVAGIAALVFFLLIKNIYIFKRFPFLTSLNCMYLSMCVVWILYQYYWVVPILLLVVIMNTIAGLPSVVYFFTDKIEFPSVPKKIIQWEELSNVVLKDQLLSIDFKNDRLLQAEIDDANSIDESAFNDFAKGHLAAIT
ncbi:MAG: hypothetical protein ABJA78_12230 [Ferruginibacter sp.]